MVQVEIALSDSRFPQTIMFVRSFRHKSAYGRDIAEYTCNVDGSETFERSDQWSKMAIFILVDNVSKLLTLPDRVSVSIVYVIRESSHR